MPRKSKKTEKGAPLFSHVSDPIRSDPEREKSHGGTTKFFGSNHPRANEDSAKVSEKIKHLIQEQAPRYGLTDLLVPSRWRRVRPKTVSFFETDVGETAIVLRGRSRRDEKMLTCWIPSLGGKGLELPARIKELQRVLLVTVVYNRNPASERAVPLYYHVSSVQDVIDRKEYKDSRWHQENRGYERAVGLESKVVAAFCDGWGLERSRSRELDGTDTPALCEAVYWGLQHLSRRPGSLHHGKDPDPKKMIRKES